MKIPFNSDNWQGRTDPQDGDLGLRWHNIVNQSSQLNKTITILGFASDEGVKRNQGRHGAKQAPNSIRKALSNLPVHTKFDLIDQGDIGVENENLESAQTEFATLASQSVTDQGLTIGLGGGHEIAWASYQALRLAKPNAKIGILNFDAHLDLRQENRPTSGTPFLQALQDNPDRTRYKAIGISRASNTAALLQTASDHVVLIRYDQDCTVHDLQDAKADLARWFDDLDAVYLSIDLDAFPCSLAPGVSAPAARGITPDFVEPLLKQVVDSHKLCIMDVAELNPDLDIDTRTARLAARLIFTVVDQFTKDQPLL